MVNPKGVSMRAAASVRSRVVGRLPAGSWCTVAEECAVGGTRRPHAVHPREAGSHLTSKKTECSFAGPRTY